MMGDKEDYLTIYRVFFENFAANVNPEDQLPVHIAGYTITEAELPGEVLYWTTQYLAEKQCPLSLMTPLRRIILDEVRTASKKYPNEFGFKSEESVYIALRLMQAVTARVNDVCLRYLDNSRLDSLPPPPTGLKEHKTVSSATKNSRRAMEDRHVEIGNLEALFGIETTEPTSFYAVYDGHAGSAAATYCAAHLHQYLVESPHFTTDLKRALRDAFLRTDAEFVRKSNQERANGGSTAVGVATRGCWLHAAWAGDSLALLAKRMRLMQLVRPHKPGRQDERTRIESSGGTVMYWGTWRVNGQLAVSRAIGDAQYKPYVTARPEIVSVELDGDEDFVVIACDGLWDFVSEDDVALAVYRQIAADPDDLKLVTKRLTIQAKRQGSSDNISIIVVFLKDPRDIAADNSPPMELGLDNAMVNVPPFALDADACKRQPDVAADDGGECADADTEEAAAAAADNGVDNSDSDSEDLGPETAVDADDVDPESRNHDPAPPTPPAHTVEESHVDGALVDNVAESGEESEDEWNYYKGEGEREKHNTVEEPDEQPRSETPCQDNSAWESSSVDMNSSPLNPDAPVFVPGNVSGADVLLAESPRKPLPMDDIELPDVAQFQTEAVVRPAELLDLDNCDQLNGHHNASLGEIKEHLNGNENCNMESLGFGFSVGLETDKSKDKDTNILQDFERIQKDTTDFCNIQVYQAHTESNPFAVDSNDELFERLKNKERDPMNMSFYQEKDDDSCERLAQNESNVDLNAVQPLPESDDEDLQPNGLCDNLNEIEKENIYPENNINLLVVGHIQEPNNDINKLEDRTQILSNNVVNFGQGDNFCDFNVTSSSFSNIDFESGNVPQETVLQTDTPESHKLLFEQIPEIPDGKSSELGFTNEDLLDPSESEKDLRVTPQEDISQDIEMDSKPDPSQVEIQSEFISHEEHTESECTGTSENVISESDQDKDNEIVKECDITSDIHVLSSEPLLTSPLLVDDSKTEEIITPEPSHDIQEHTVVDVHQNSDSEPVFNNMNTQIDVVKDETAGDIKDNAALEIKVEAELLSTEATVIQDFERLAESPLPIQSPLLAQLQQEIELTKSPSPSPIPSKSPVPAEFGLTNLPLPVQSPVSTVMVSPVPAELSAPAQSPAPHQSQQHIESEFLTESPLPTHSPALSPLPQAGQEVRTDSPLPAEVPLPRESPIPSDSSIPAESMEPTMLLDSSVPVESPLPTHSPIPTDIYEASAPIESTIVLPPHLTGTISPVQSPIPCEGPNSLPQSPMPTELPALSEALPVQSSILTEATLPSHSPLPVESPVLADSTLQTESIPEITQFGDSPLPDETSLRPETASPAITSPIPYETEFTHVPAVSPIHIDTEDKQAESRLTPEVPSQVPELNGDDAKIQCEESQVESISGPTPDIVPDERAETIRSELVTDIDIGIPESRAQEICMPVTSEIQQEDGVQPGATPPPTPAVEPPAPLAAVPVADTPIAADIVPAAVAAAAAVAGTATAVAVATTTKKAPAKKSPTTPTSAKGTPKSSTIQKTPASTVKKTATATSKTPVAASKTPTKTLSSVTKTPTSKPTTPAAKTTPKPPTPKVPTAKPATRTSGPVKEASAVTKTAATTRAPVAARPAPKAPAAAPKPAAKAPSTRPATAPVTKAAPARPAAPATATRPATAAKTSTTKVPEKKPLVNGDVKVPAKRPTAAPATKPAARPAPAAARPAPRPAARATAPTAATAAKMAAPKPAPRAAAPRPTLDKQTKDLANKRITAKAAPPRTATTKVPPGKTTLKSVPKKSPEPPKKEEAPTNGVGGEELRKPPPSPPAADNALLPDVIA